MLEVRNGSLAHRNSVGKNGEENVDKSEASSFANDGCAIDVWQVEERS